MPATIEETTALSELTLEMLMDFYASQIDAGAALPEEVAAHIHACASRVAERLPDHASLVKGRAAELAASLPEGWASGDDPDWQEPA